MSLNILFAQSEQKDSLLYNKHDFFLQNFNPAAVTMPIVQQAECRVLYIGKTAPAI